MDEPVVEVAAVIDEPVVEVAVCCVCGSSDNVQCCIIKRHVIVQRGVSENIGLIILFIVMQLSN